MYTMYTMYYVINSPNYLLFLVVFIVLLLKGCAICPDCKPGQPCDPILCDGDCVVCLGKVPPGKACGKLKDMMESADRREDVRLRNLHETSVETKSATTSQPKLPHHGEFRTSSALPGCKTCENQPGEYFCIHEPFERSRGHWSCCGVQKESDKGCINPLYKI